MSSETAIEQTIRLRAYDLWIAADMTGDAESHWLSAERELLIEKGSVAALPVAAKSMARKSISATAASAPGTKAPKAATSVRSRAAKSVEPKAPKSRAAAGARKNSADFGALNAAN